MSRKSSPPEADAKEVTIYGDAAQTEVAFHVLVVVNPKYLPGVTAEEGLEQVSRYYARRLRPPRRKWN